MERTRPHRSRHNDEADTDHELQLAAKVIRPSSLQLALSSAGPSFCSVRGRQPCVSHGSPLCFVAHRQTSPAHGSMYTPAGAPRSFGLVPRASTVGVKIRQVRQESASSIVRARKACAIVGKSGLVSCGALAVQVSCGTQRSPSKRHAVRRGAPAAAASARCPRPAARKPRGRRHVRRREAELLGMPRGCVADAHRSCAPRAAARAARFGRRAMRAP